MTGGLSAGCGSGWMGSALRTARARRGMGSVPMKKERRTKDASGAPAKGHGERALADAPLRGAAFKALPLQLKLGGFPESSGLTLARRSIVARATYSVPARLFYAENGSGRRVDSGPRPGPIQARLWPWLHTPFRMFLCRSYP